MTGNPVGCSGKKAFTSYWSAARGAKNLNKFMDSTRANPYKCPNCHAFHVGNTMGKKQPKRHSRHTNKEEFNRGRIQFPE
jgi:hypothetical protein